MFFDEPVIGGKYTSDWGEEDGVSAHKGQERLSGRENLPGDDDPAANDSSNHTTALDVNVTGKQDCEIVGCGYGVRCDVRPNLRDIPGRRGEEGSSSTAMAGGEPVVDDIERIPEQFTVNYTSGGSGHNTNDGAEGEDDWQEGELDELAPGGAGITREVGDVTGQC